MSVQSIPQQRLDLRSALLWLTIALCVVAFREALLELVNRWTRQEEYGHGFFIPVIAAWLLWRQRETIRQNIGQPAWSGIGVIALAAVMHVLGELSAIFILSQVGFVVALCGIVLVFGGYSLLRATFVPIFFLLFAIPLPYFIDSMLTWRLQLISSELGVFVITLFGIPVYLEGNVIDLGHYKLQVVEACSGLRYLFPLFSLGFLAAYLFQAPLWQRGLVLLSTIPIAIVMNSLRIGMVGVMADRWGPQSADGLLHLFEGWIIFIACAALLAGEIYLLARMSGRGFVESFHLPGDETVPAPRAVTHFKPLVSVVGMLAVTGLFVAGALVSGRQELVPERSRFVSFPSHLGEWRGRASAMQPQIEHALGLEDYILTDYSRADGKEVNFYVAYYSSQRKGVSPHSPTVCIPGGGWLITQFERTNIVDGSARLSLPTNRVVIEKNSAKRIVYYWFDQRGRKIANEWWSKWYLLVDAISINRTDGALVRLTTAVYPGESERDAERRLQTLIPLLVPNLAAYLPSGPATHTTRALSGPTDNRS